MRHASASFLAFIVATSPCVAQVGGNIGYGQPAGHAQAEQGERAKRQLTHEEMPPSDSTMFLDASVLINVKADQFVATFGIAEEAETVEACQAKMDSTIAAFTEALKPLRIGPDDLFFDFSAQTKVYNFKIEDSVAREQLGGFGV